MIIKLISERSFLISERSFLISERSKVIDVSNVVDILIYFGRRQIEYPADHIVYVNDLKSKSIKLNGIKIWGGSKLTKIPINTDILITHIPPYGILDSQLGCKDLKLKVDQIKPKFHCFSFPRSKPGIVVSQYTTFINVTTNPIIINC